MPFILDILREKGKYFNTPLSFTKRDNTFSPAYRGNKEEFNNQMESNKSLFEQATSVYDSMNFDNPIDNTVDLDFLAQQKQWQALNESLLQTRTKGSTVKTRLLGFDLETLGADVSRPYATNSNMAITELGITETIVSKTTSNSNSYSIAGGIEETQLKKYLEYYKTYKEKGLSGFDRSEKNMVKSLMDRLSVYGQTDINDVYQIEHITNLGDVVTINPLSAHAGTRMNPDTIERGLMHLSILGGLSKETWNTALSDADIKVGYSYEKAQRKFKDAGLKKQVFSQDSELGGKVKKFFGKNLPNVKSNTFILGYNSNSFDLNVIRQIIGDTLNKSNTIDAYTGFKAISNGQDIALATKIASDNGIKTGITRATSQEGLATAQGIATGVAHNAGYDSRVVNELIAKEEFYDGKSFSQLASDVKIPVPNILSEDKKIYYALDSLSFDKNGSDYLSNASMFHLSGVQRGRYYYIDDVRQYENGKYGIKFISAVDSNEEFVKVFDTIEDMQKTMHEKFLIDNAAKKTGGISEDLKVLNDNISISDRARRNYESLYDTSSISYNKKISKLDGGYERLNQYYKAYKISANEIGEINSDTISKIINGEYDEQLKQSLEKVLPDGQEVYNSLLRDFKYMYGKIHDESEIFEYIEQSLDGTDFNNYQKTLAAKKIRNGIIQKIEEEYQQPDVKDYSRASRRDLFDVDIYMKDAPTRINFETAGAVDSLTKNFYGKSTTKNSMDVANSMVESVGNLYSRGIVNTDFLIDFYRTAGVNNQTAFNLIKDSLKSSGMPDNEIDKLTSSFIIRPTNEIQPRKLAEMLTSYIQNTYIKPIQKSGYSYTNFVAEDGSFSYFSDNKKNGEKFINFMKNKTSRLSGNISLSKALGSEYINTQTKEIVSANSIFSGLDRQALDGTTQKILSNIGLINSSLDKDKIKEVLIKDLNYTEGSADETIRMLGKGNFGLSSYKNDDGKVKYITQFAYSGKNGDDAFVLVNLNEPENVNFAKTLEIMADTDMSFKEKIDMIRESGFSAVLPVKAINKHEINPDEAVGIFNYTDIEGNNASYSQNTVTTGDAGYKKTSQFHLSIWDHDSDDLEKLDITLTDDATSVPRVFRQTKKSLFDDTMLSVINDTSLSETEKYIKISKRFKKAEDKIISSMPGLTGYFAVPTENGGWIKANIPTKSDTLLSSQLSLQPLEVLVLQTARKDLEVAKNIIGENTIPQMLARLFGIDKSSSPKKDFDYIIKNVKNGEEGSKEFREFFYKHLFTPMNLEEEDFANDINYSFMDYIKQSLDKGYYSEETRKTINWLISNESRISQIVKEKAEHDKKVFLIDSMKFNQNAHMSSTIRPVANQVQNDYHYVLENVVNEMSDVSDKLNLTFGYDYMPIQEAQRRNAYSDVYDKFESVITTNVRQMDSTELIGRMHGIEEDVINNNEWFESIYKGVIDKYDGLSEETSKQLMTEAFNIVKANSSNVYADRTIARTSFTDNQLFKSPEIKTVEINAIDEADYDFLLNNSKTIKDILKTHEIKRGSVFKLSDGRTIKYHGPSGTINDSIKDFFLTGKAHLIEEMQGTQAVKMFFGVNEKATMNVPEFDKSAAFDRFRKIGGNLYKSGQNKEAILKDLLHYYSDAIYDKLLGENVSVAGNFGINKHGSNDIIEGSYLNTIFYRLNKYTGDKKDAFTQLQQILHTAAPNGYRFGIYKGQVVYDDSQLGNSGLVEQVRNARKEIFKRANDTQDKHHALWKSIADEITYNEKNNIFRTTAIRAVRVESTGGAMYMDPRMALSFNLKFHEEIPEFNDKNTNLDDFDNLLGIKIDDGNVRFQQYILDKIKEETLDDLNPDTSKTPISSAMGKKYKSAEKTVQGIHLSSQYMYNPEELQNSNMVLDLDLDDIKIIPSNEDADELMKTGMFKMVNEEGNVYSNQLKALAGSKNLDDIVALRIALPDGIAFSMADEAGKVKQVNHLLVPLYDISPVKGKVQNTQRIRDLNTALEIAKGFLDKDGLKESQENLDKAVEKLFNGFISDLNEQNKKSYIYQNLLRLPMKNSRMLHAESSIAPVVKAMSDDYYKWYDKAEDSYRDKILQAVKTGDIKEYNIDFSEHTNKYTVIKNDKMYYEDVVEFGREGFEEFGFNFKTSGRDLFYDILNNEGKNYRPIIKEMDHGFFDEINRKTVTDIIDKKIDNTEVLKAMQSLEEYNALQERLKHRKKFEEHYREQYFKKHFGDMDLVTPEEKSRAGLEAKQAATKYFREVKEQMKILDNSFERLSEAYLSRVGIFSMVGRWPTKDEGSMNIVVARLAKDLKRDDIRVTPALIERLHGDFDGDNLLNKMFLGKGGEILSSATKEGKKLLTALTKSYEFQVFKPFVAKEFNETTGQWENIDYISRNNREVAKLVKDNIEKIDESLGREITLEDGSKITIGNPADYVTDMVDGKINIAREKTMIDKFMSVNDRQRILTELGLKDIKEVSVDKYSDEVVHKVFNVWNKEYGNMLKNLSVIMASDKSRENKSGIGTVSNIDYKLNQVLLESLDDALARNDKAAKKKLNEIKTFLHLGATGFIPDTEQYAIDVKHVSQGATTAQIEKFSKGVNELFNGNAKNGEALIRKAMQSKFKDQDAFEKGLQQLIEFSKDTKVRDLYNLKVSPTLKKDLKSNLKIRKQIEKTYNYYLKNNMLPNTAFGSSFQALQELRTAYNMGYTHNGIFQSLAESQVYIASENGSLVLYRASQNMQGKNGNYAVNFEKINLNSLTKKAEWQKATPIKGTAIEIQSILQEKFGDYRSYSIAEVLGDVKKFKKGLRKTAKTVNANKYANMYSRGNTVMAEKFLEELQSVKGNESTVDLINAYKNAASKQQYTDFINKARFIQSMPDYQKVNKKGKRYFETNPSGIEDLLTNINKQIIELGKKANPTSTSVIFNNALKEIATEFGLSQLEGQDFTNTHKTPSDLFNGFETQIIDIRKARKDLSSYSEIQNEVDILINRYKRENSEYIRELQSQLKKSVVISSDYNDIFGWNSDKLEDMRVSFDTENGLFGRRFSDLSEEDINEILNFKGTAKEGSLFEYSINTTKANLRKYYENKNRVTTNVLQGAREKDKIKLTELMNERIKQNAETATEGLNAKGKKISKEYAGQLLNKTLDSAKSFMTNHPNATKALMGLGALGLVSNILSSNDNQSPLAPELKHKNSTGPTNNDANPRTKAPASTGKKVVYSDSSSGLEFKMSAKSKQKINQMQMARQISSQNGGNTNINIYDDRSQVSNNWLERKFSELV